MVTQKTNELIVEVNKDDFIARIKLKLSAIEDEIKDKEIERSVIFKEMEILNDSHDFNNYTFKLQCVEFIRSYMNSLFAKKGRLISMIGMLCISNKTVVSINESVYTSIYT